MSKPKIEPLKLPQFHSVSATSNKIIIKGLNGQFHDEAWFNQIQNIEEFPPEIYNSARRWKDVKALMEHIKIQKKEIENFKKENLRLQMEIEVLFKEKLFEKLNKEL